MEEIKCNRWLRNWILLIVTEATLNAPEQLRRCSFFSTKVEVFVWSGIENIRASMVLSVPRRQQVLGDQMSLWKNYPKCSSTHFFKTTLTLTDYKSSSQTWDTSVIFKKLPRVNNRPVFENSPDLVTLASSYFQQRQSGVNHCNTFRPRKAPETVWPEIAQNWASQNKDFYPKKLVMKY
jgi:hypothetical protein